MDSLDSWLPTTAADKAARGSQGMESVSGPQMPLWQPWQRRRQEALAILLIIDAIVSKA